MTSILCRLSLTKLFTGAKKSRGICQICCCHTGAVTLERKKSNKYSKTMNFGAVKMKNKFKHSELRNHDSFIHKEMKFDDLYRWQRQNDKLNKSFILHDGPPYANGNLHMGHAVNKVLKDTIARHKLLIGHRIHLKPGWDCHGLPIELKAAEEQNGNPSALQIRRSAHAYATKMLEIQKQEFHSLGLMVDWDNVYKTYDKSYIISQLRLFYQLYEKGLIFQDILPVNLSPSSRTVLAEAEIEYRDYTSSTIYTAFQVINLPAPLQKKLPSLPLYLPIWTSKPWTIPMNSLVSCSPHLSYAVVQVSSEGGDILLLWSRDLLQNLEKIVKEHRVVEEIVGYELEGITYKRPFQDTSGLLVPADFVTDKRGSGLVHLSPAHGHEDFHLAKKLGIEVVNMVDISGKYKEEIGWGLGGKEVLQEGDEAVIKLLETQADKKTLLLNKDTLTHTHPHDWRQKTPLITSALHQWFFDISKIKRQCLDVVEKTLVFPEVLKKELMKHITTRDYWCISRQRVWGVAIPVFYDAVTREPLLNSDTIHHLCNVIEEHGPDAWWELPEEDLLPNKLVQSYIDSSKQLPRKGHDILDIWFDSGSSWHCVLPGDKTADLYLEGIDQLSAWFQTSLFTSVAARGDASYKALYIHGFVVDENKRKMSKSLGNITTPLQLMYGEDDNHNNNTKQSSSDELLEPLGIDPLRLWICWNASYDLMSIKDVKKMKLRVLKIRMTLKFLLNHVHDYDMAGSVVATPITLPLHEMRLLDRYMLHCLYHIVMKVQEEYETMQFGSLCRRLYSFIEELSDVYLNIIKDRMQSEVRTGTARRSGRTCVDHLLKHLCHCFAPVLPYLIEEVSALHPHNFIGNSAMESPATEKHNFSVFKKLYEVPPKHWNQPKLYEDVSQLLLLRQQLHESQGWIGKKTEGYKYGAVLNSNSKLVDVLQRVHPKIDDLHSELCEILEVSEVQFKDGLGEEAILEIYDSKHELCLRCWKKTCPDNVELCQRCEEAVDAAIIK